MQITSISATTTQFTEQDMWDLSQCGSSLIANVSSCVMSEEIDVSKFGLLFAGAQKNLGPAGVTLVIVREDLIGDAMDITPTMLDYKPGHMPTTAQCTTLLRHTEYMY